MPDLIEPATTGRAKCRACGEVIAKGTLRFGERAPNPFAEGESESEVTYWFHVPCAAHRRPERFAAIAPDQLEPVADAAGLLDVARRGVEHPRLARIAGVEHAKSGRAKCRHCQEPIAADSERLVLSIWQEGRFEPMGFIHRACAPDYFGTADLAPWLRFVDPG